MFRANAVYEGLYLLGASIARPLLAKRLDEIAAETVADAVAYGKQKSLRSEFKYDRRMRMSYISIDGRKIFVRR